jgi:hypothetical protein
MLLDRVEGGQDAGEEPKFKPSARNSRCHSWGTGWVAATPRPLVVRAYRASLRTNNPPPTSRIPAPSPESVA